MSVKTGRIAHGLVGERRLNLDRSKAVHVILRGTRPPKAVNRVAGTNVFQRADGV